MSSDDEHAIAYEVLPKGTPVVASDGTQVGTVAQVLDNAREPGGLSPPYTDASRGHPPGTGIVVKTDDGRRFVDAPEVARITNRRVTLTIDAAAVRALPEHHGALGGLAARLGLTAGRRRR